MPVTPQIQQEPSGFQPHLFQEQTQRFLSSRSRRGLSPGTIQYYSFHLLGLDRFLAARKEPLHPSTFPELLQTMIYDMLYPFLFPDEEWSLFQSLFRMTKTRFPKNRIALRKRK